ncbi:phosphoribosylglycinamide formyltransferase [Metabacillus sp. RGM 3146]|uniref:phosphoribosylglycinamide formyltransferase n=1 Tax=Metabacillus sp. RGM 3146 TaxID=3401092 RepID=UPI003B9A65DB
MKKAAIFASGSGSNFQAIVNAVKAGKLYAEIALLVCDREDAYVLERARREGIPAFSFNPKNYENKAAFENEILEELKEREIGWIFLAGYMRLIGETLLKAYPNRIVNLHPSILPSFPGKNAIGQAFEAGVKLTGLTIHFVDEGMDTGPIIAQTSIDIKESDTLESLTERVHETEHSFFPYVLQQLLDDKIKVVPK